MEDWISKKDLLDETKISYGQLYRWKREGLIPDSWFIKRSAFTGQETFLPRARATERIRFILEHKDQYSLQQLQDLLSPNSESRVYTADMLMQYPDTLRPMMSMMELSGTEKLNHGQALCVLIASEILRACGGMDDASLMRLLQALSGWQDAFNYAQNPDGRLLVLRVNGAYLPLYCHPESHVEVGPGGEIAFDLPLTDISTEYNRKLNRIFEEE